MKIEKQIKKIVSELCGGCKVSIKDELQNDLFMDSLSLVTLLIEIEEAFQIELNESDMNPYELVTVRDVVNLVEKYI